MKEEITVGFQDMKAEIIIGFQEMKTKRDSRCSRYYGKLSLSILILAIDYYSRENQSVACCATSVFEPRLCDEEKTATHR